jgi:orotate phosphoribosyltransferase-like protein|tara:strand:- start:282 stop:560 length:279 start_codon:yes stop_codon:yes gene_type:complete
MVVYAGSDMALNPSDIAKLLKMRALGFNQAEIADALNTSQQVIAYQLKKLKEQAKKKGTDEVFNAALIGGLTGAAAGIGMYAILELLNKQNK